MARGVEIRQPLAPRIELEAGKDGVVSVPLNDELLEHPNQMHKTKSLKELFAKELFAKLFTPKHPNQMLTTQWVSLTRLAETVKPYAPGQVWNKGPGDLKQLVIEWYQDHHVFASLEANAWCKQLPDFDAPGHMVSKFCFAYTPN